MGGILSGLLIGLCFPTLVGGFSTELWPLAWIALVPLYHQIAKAKFKLRGATIATGIAGFISYGFSLYWIFIAMHRYGGVSIPATLLAILILVLILTAYLVLATTLAVFLRSKGMPFSLALPLAWVSQDWVRNYFPFGGFSWSSLAYSQSGPTGLIQIADLTGPYGVTFLIVLTNALIGEVLLFLRKKRGVPRRLVAFWTLLIGLTLVYGLIKKELLSRTDLSLPEKKLLLVQGNVPQEEKWISEEMEGIIEHHALMTLQAEGQFKPDLLIWPEAAYPAVIPPDIIKIGILDRFQTPLLMGVVTYEGKFPEDWPPSTESGFHLHNSGLIVEPGGFLGEVYHKNHLVPMGEYVPLKPLLFFVEKLVPGYSEFSPGEKYHLLEAAGMKLGVTICYEDLFPEISRKFVREGADLLINLTNDGWYERSSAVLQHAVFSRFRAIENRRYLARTTNTGVTAVFAPTGEVVASAPLFQAATLPATVKLGGPVTFYTRFGDWFVGLCGLVVAGWLIGQLRRG